MSHYLSPEAQAELTKELTELEEFRLKQLKLYKMALLISKPSRFMLTMGGIAGALCVFLPFLLPICLPFAIVGIGYYILDNVLYHFVFKKPDEKFVERFKGKLMPKLMKSINPTFEYDYNKSISKKSIEAMEVFKSEISTCRGEDYVEGKIKGVDVRFSEHWLWKYKPTGVKDILGDIAGGVLGAIIDTEYEGSADKEIRFFNGLIMQADFHKETKGKILIIPKSTLKSFIFKKNRFKGQPTLEMNHPEFDEHFTVFARLEHNANYALTPALMDRMVSLMKKMACPIYLSIVRGQLNLAIHWNQDLFESSIHRPIGSIDDLDNLFAELLIFEELIEHLLQDQRIWGSKAVPSED